jgi:branched-subunit amino acid transport protein AzlD
MSSSLPLNPPLAAETVRAQAASVPLSNRQLAIIITFGIIFWLIAALFIRIAPFGLFARGPATIALFMVTMLVAWLPVRLLTLLAALSAPQLVPGVAIASAAAMLLDGVGLIWWPVYGAADRLPGAAWLLWGVGWILIAAYGENHRQKA